MATWSQNFADKLTFFEEQLTGHIDQAQTVGVDETGFRIGGKIIARHVETGDRVVQGQLLMQLDPEDSTLQCEVAHSDWIAARSQLAQMEAEENRMRPLVQNRSVSKSEYDIALAARDTARARLDAAERRKQLAANQKSYCDL